MRVDSCKSSPTFGGGLNNKYLLKGLETVSEHGASFIAVTSFIMGAGVRPLVVHFTPGIEKENKQYAEVNSFSSGLVKFLMAEAVALPVEGAVKKIGENPDKFLKKETVENLKSNAKSLAQSRDYKFLTQLIKLSAGFLTAIPKSMLTIALIPVLMDKIFKTKKQDIKPITDNQKYSYDPVFDPVSKNISFGKNPKDMFVKGVSGVMNFKPLQNFVKKHSFNDVNIARNMSVATDILLAGSAVLQTKHSDKIKEERKNPLIYNSLFSTGISIVAGCALDKLAQNAGSGLVEKFKQANKNDPKLLKYLEGINIIRPTLIFALVYYGILPAVSTYFADKTDKFIANKNK